jgi:signal transduction histidine kinase
MGLVSARLWQRPLYVRSAYLCLLAVVLPLLVWNGFVQQINSTFLDILLRMRPSAKRGGVQEIVLLAIDDGTLARYGPLPLKRSILADGLKKLYALAPRVVAIDLLLAEATTSSEDERLAEALRLFRRRLVLAAALASGANGAAEWILPTAAFRHDTVVAHVHAAPDSDGDVRSVLLAKSNGIRRFWALGLEAVRMAHDFDRPLETRSFVGIGDIRIPASSEAERAMTINYAGPEGTFATVPFSAILAGSVAREIFRNKIVILGVTAQGGGDRLFTPMSSGIGMSGIEIHANVARTVLDRAFLAPLNLLPQLALYAALAGVCVLGIGRYRGWRLIGLLAIIALLLPLASIIALQQGIVWPLGSLYAVFLASAGIAGVSEYAFVTAALKSSEQKRREYAFRVQAIAHEIKTPLTAIQGSSELISEQILPETERLEMASLIHKESGRLVTLIHTFLDVERLAAGTLTIELRPVELKAIVDEVLERARLYAARKKTRIEVEVPPIMLDVDSELLSFAVYNLLTNAVKYSPKQSLVLLQAREANGSISLSVADQGYGIAAADQQKIFEKFYRVKHKETTSEEGSGIGLALVKEIVTQHGGRILVESKPGAGSRFTILLPARRI